MLYSLHFNFCAIDGGNSNVINFKCFNSFFLNLMPLWRLLSNYDFSRLVFAMGTCYDRRFDEMLPTCFCLLDY